jgi:hypothetical protein
MIECWRCKATGVLAVLPEGAVYQLCVSCKEQVNDWFWSERVYEGLLDV